MKFGFIFPGQGSQSIGMGREIYDNFAEAKELLESASSFCGIDFFNLLFTDNDEINISQFTQPAIVLNSLMCYLALKSRIEIKPEFLLGHSLGEFSALSVGGGMDFIDTMRVVNLRGKFMQSACEGKDAGMMVVLGLDDKKVEDICANANKSGAKIWPANYNCEAQIVLAGSRSDMLKFESDFKTAGAKRTMILNMSVASHCPMLKDASESLSLELTTTVKAKFSDIVSNASTEIYSDKSEAIRLLRAQLVSPVLYKQSILAHEDKVDCFVEFGSSILKGLNKKITQKPTHTITDLASLDAFCTLVDR